MPREELYHVKIVVSREVEDSIHVKMNPREVKFLERGLKQAEEDEKILEFSIEPSNMATFEDLLHWAQENPLLSKYFGPREWVPKEKEEEPWPFIEIYDRRLICSRCPGDEKLEFPATKTGAKALGQELASRNIKKWLYSSSVDFPTEYGARNLDFRSIIETAAGMDISEER